MLEVEVHPYGNFIVPKTKILLLGSFPIGKFTHDSRAHQIKNHEMDFYYGGEKNLLWSLIGLATGQNLLGIENVKRWLVANKISVADVVKSCRRSRGNALDSNLIDITWNRDLNAIIQSHHINKLLFTSQWVRQKFYKHIYPECPSQAFQLLSPSPAASISISRLPAYRAWLKNNPHLKTFDYRVLKYREVLTAALMNI